MGKHRERAKRSFINGLEKAGKVIRSKAFPFIVGGAAYLATCQSDPVTAAIGSLIVGGATYAVNRLVRMKDEFRGIEKQLENIPLEEIESDLKIQYENYAEAYMKWKDKPEFKLLHQEMTDQKQLDVIIERMKKAGLKMDDNFIMTKSQDYSGFYILGTKTKLISSSTGYDIIESSLHEHIHANWKKFFDHRPKETEVQACTLGYLKDMTKDLVGEVHVEGQLLVNTEAAYLRKIQTEKVAQNRVKEYIKQLHDISLKVKGDADFLPECLLDAEKDWHSIKFEKEGFPYSSDIYIHYKVNEMKKEACQILYGRLHAGAPKSVPSNAFIYLSGPGSVCRQP